MPVNVTTEDYASTILAAGGKAILDVWAEWCPPCKMMNPILEEIDGTGIHVFKLDADANPTALAQLGVQSLPTMIIFKDGVEVDRIIGAVSRDVLVDRLVLAD